MKTITIDLKDVKTAQDIFDRFQELFQFEFHPKGWDSLNSSFTNLDTDSKMYKNIIANEKEIHFIVKNIDDVKKVPVTKGLLFNSEYLTLIDVLVCATDKADRSGSKGDNINFTFEVMNDE